MDAISTHAPRTGSDPNVHSPQRIGNAFQPTLPARGATRMRVSMPRHSMRFQPTLPARGATRNAPPRSKPTVFQPTLPARGATSSTQYSKPCFWYFNPRSPHEKAEQRAAAAISTHAPRTGSDERHCAGADGCAGISTHAPRTGSDSAASTSPSVCIDFNPRSPHGERHCNVCQRVDCHKFQPTLPARGATATCAGR